MSITGSGGPPIEGEEAAAEESAEQELQPEPIGVTPGSSEEEAERKFNDACVKDWHSLKFMCCSGCTTMPLAGGDGLLHPFCHW